MKIQNLGYHPRWVYEDEFGCRCISPAMVARIHDIQGELVGLHSTMITHMGAKRLDSKGKKITRLRSADRSLTGAAIRLNMAGKVLGLAEGVETALALGLLHNVPVWSCCNAVLLSQVQLPDTVEKIVVAVDHDSAGRSAASKLEARLSAQGREVVLIHASAHGLPEHGDLADLLLSRY